MRLRKRNSSRQVTHKNWFQSTVFNLTSTLYLVAVQHKYKTIFLSFFFFLVSLSFSFLISTTTTTTNTPLSLSRRVTTERQVTRCNFIARIRRQNQKRTQYERQEIRFNFKKNKILFFLVGTPEVYYVFSRVYFSCEISLNINQKKKKLFNSDFKCVWTKENTRNLFVFKSKMILLDSPRNFDKYSTVKKVYGLFKLLYVCG